MTERRTADELASPGVRGWDGGVSGVRGCGCGCGWRLDEEETVA